MTTHETGERPSSARGADAPDASSSRAPAAQGALVDKAAAHSLSEANLARALREAECDLTLFVPCLNEAPRVTGTLTNIRAAMLELPHSYEVIVIDDGSSDDTYEVVRRFARAHPDVSLRLHRNEVNQGLARCYVDAAFLGRGRWFRMVWGDDIEPKDSMVAVFRLLDSADLVVPHYPEVKRSTYTRALLSHTYTGLVNGLSGHRLHYYNGSVLVRRYDVIRWAPRSSGFTGFLADMITLLLDNGATVREVAVAARDSGDEKAGSSITLKNLLSTGHTLQQVLLRRVRNEFFNKPRHQRLGHR